MDGIYTILKKWLAKIVNRKSFVCIYPLHYAKIVHLEIIVMDIHLSYKRAYMKDLLKKSNMPDASMLVGEAVALMEWALNETIEGKIIVALDMETEEAQPILAYSLEHAKTLRAPKTEKV